MLNQFRRSVAADTAKKGGKGGKGSWYEKLRLPQNTPTPFLLINAEYVDPTADQKGMEVDHSTGKVKQVKNAYFKFRKHKRKLFKNGKESYPDIVCSAGSNPHNPQPCAGCQAQEMGDKSVTTSDTFAIGLVHLHPYHGHPIVDYKTKSYMTKKDNSGYVMGYDPCEGRNCNYCRVMNGAQPVLQQGESFPFTKNDITTVFGRRRYLELGRNHLADLVGWDQQIGSVCSTVHGKDPLGNPQVCAQQLTTDGYQCPNCKSVVIDMAQDPRTDEEIAQAVINPYPCLQCQRPVLLQEVVSCEKCDAMNEAYVSGGQKNPGFKATQLSLFDVVLWGCRQGQDTNSHLHLSRSDTVDMFSKTVPPEILGGKTVQQVIEDLAKPYEFDDIFKVRTLEEQAERLQISLQHQPQSYGAPQSPFQNQNLPIVPVVGGPAPVVPQHGFQPTPYPMGPPPIVATPTGTPGQGPAPFVPNMKPNFGNKQ